MWEDAAYGIHDRPHAIPGPPEWFYCLWRPMPCAAGTSTIVERVLIINCSVLICTPREMLISGMF